LLVFFVWMVGKLLFLFVLLGSGNEGIPQGGPRLKPWVPYGNGKNNGKARQGNGKKYRDLSATHWTVRLSSASVEMTFVWGWERTTDGNRKATAGSSTP